MRARLRSKGFSNWSRIWVSTYHSLGRYILSCYGGDIGIREDFKIIEKYKRDSVLKRLINNYSVDLSCKDLGSIFEKLKREGIYPGKDSDYPSSPVREAYKEYNQILRDKNFLDFEDLIALTVQLMQKSDFVNGLFTSFFRYVVVDEFQDTDSQQLEMIRLFAEPAIGSTIVGDDDQSIFGYRGALRQNVFKIRELLNSTEFVLSQNFRSNSVIVEAAKRVIGLDPERRDKNMEPVLKERGHLYKCHFYDYYDEAEYVAKWIRGTMENMVDDSGDIAVISRNHYRTDEVKKEMKRKSIPWFDRHSLKFDDSWETALALSVIELAHDPTSSLFLYRVMASVEEGGLAFHLSDKNALDVAIKIRDRLKSSKNLELCPHEVYRILYAAGMMEIIENVSAGVSDAQRRTQNLEKMMKNISSEAKKHEIDLFDVVKRFSGHGAVQIISGHKAKGTEFDVVFFIGLEDDILPDHRSHNDEDKLAEERRIFYVGLTRARKAAYLTSATNKPPRNVICAPSRFINHIPDDYFSEVTF
jgi:DNA helicase-2/ATP-dependent DNA helicase PcrA